MKYLMTGIELHPDFGFGITADAYYKSAEHLMENHFEHYDVTQQAEMPQNYLFRHTIELYLKSLIILFHKKLEIDYGTVPFDSDEPEANFDGNWRKLYTSHFIDKLYHYWLNELLLPNTEILEKLAPGGDWIEYKKITELFEIISKYDRDSSYFRYPITKNAGLDNHKYSMQKFKATDLESFLDEIKDRKANGKGKMTMLMLDNEDNITSAFSKEENILSDVRDALKEVAYYFNSIHVMCRVTLFDGM